MPKPSAADQLLATPATAAAPATPGKLTSPEPAWVSKSATLPTSAASGPASAPAPRIMPGPPLRPAYPPIAVNPPAASAPATPATGAIDYIILGKPEIVAASLVQVNDKFITLQQVLHPLSRQLRLAALGSDERQFRAKAADLIEREMRNQIEQMIIMEEAERRLGDEEKKAVQEDIDSTIRKAVAQAGSQAQLDKALQKEGSDLGSWKEEVKRDLTVEFYTRRRFASKIDVDRQKMLKYYQEHKAEFRQEPKVQMQVIAAPFDEFLPPGSLGGPQQRREAVAKAKAHIQEAKSELDKGLDYTEVAKKYDRGPLAEQAGVWPAMERGSFRASAVEEAAFAQKPGQVSGTIETNTGCYIVKTLQVQPGGELPFEQVQAQIDLELRRQQYRAAVSEYVKEMQKNVTIRPSAGFEKLVLDAAVRLHWEKD